ncbi:MAG: NlpC/P60 family protein [Rhizobiaceae bacterium]
MTLDRRLHAYRPDLADARLEGRVEATRFVAGRPAVVTAPVADMRRAPRPDAGLDTQLLLGDAVDVFDEMEGWAWVQSRRDGYVGHVPMAAIGAPAAPATHVVSVPRTFTYPGPDMKLPHGGVLSMGSAVTVSTQAETRGTLYAQLATGEHVVLSHLIAIGDHAVDYVSVAETLENTPYLWGGVSGFGVDCSGLVQIAMHMAGMKAPRDSDMQATGLGTPVEPGADFAELRRGDLVFWKGHVAIVTDPATILHANGHTMLVSREWLADAVARIGYLYGQPTGFRRP